MATRWTTADFDAMTWHDCHVHGFHLGAVNEEHGSAELSLDIDFILEWLTLSDQTFQFRVAPATLTFHDVSGLRVLIDYAATTAGMTPFSIDGIEREPIICAGIHTAYRWRLPISWPAGEITFESTGFTQVLIRDPVISQTQGLTTAERSR